MFYKSSPRASQKKLGKTSNKFQDYLKNPSEYSLFLKEAEPGEVLKILNNLHSKKSGDICGISPKLIRVAAENLKTDTYLSYSTAQYMMEYFKANSNRTYSTNL